MTSDQNTITTRIGRTPFLYHLKIFAVLLPIVIVSAALITLVFAEQGESYRVFRAWFIVGMLAIFIFHGLPCFASTGTCPGCGNSRNRQGIDDSTDELNQL